MRASSPSELQDRSAAAAGRTCVLGEIAIDATSDRWDPNLLFANLPGLALSWADGRAVPDAFATSQRIGEMYDTGAALHA